MAYLGDRVGCVILGIQNNKLYTVLVKSNYSKLHEIPRGGVSETESKKEALIREIYEETGIKLSSPNFKPLFKYEEYHKTRKGTLIHYDIYVYSILLNNITKLTVYDRQEIKYAKWFPFTRALKILMKEEQNYYIKALLKSLTRYCKELQNVSI